MFDRIRSWLADRRRREAAKEAASALAIAAFVRTRGTRPMGAFVLRLTDDEVLVRVMYLTNHIPPDRAWFAVYRDGAVRELEYEDVAAFETPWR